MNVEVSVEDAVGAVVAVVMEIGDVVVDEDVVVVRVVDVMRMFGSP
jgi:hypothetical protein